MTPYKTEYSVLAYAAGVPDSERVAVCDSHDEALAVAERMRERFGCAVRVSTCEYFEAPPAAVPSAPPSARKAALARIQQDSRPDDDGPKAA